MPDSASSGADDVFSFAPVPSFSRPLASEGQHNIIAVMAVFEKRPPYNKLDKNGNENPLVPTVTVYCRSEEKYEGPNGDENHLFFYSMPLSTGEETKMGVFFKAVLGSKVPVTESGEIDLRPVITDTKEDGTQRHRLPRLEGLKFSVVNTITKTKMGPNTGKPKNTIDSIFATSDQKKANADSFRRESPAVYSDAPAKAAA